MDEFFEAFFSCFEGNPAVLKWADDPGRELASLSTTGKDFLKSFLSDPNAGDLWKIDDPIWTNGGPGIPHKFFVRGLLAELDVYKRAYKPLSYTHHQTAAGFDFKGPAGAPRWVQIKSLSNPDAAIDRMKLAMDDLLNAGSSDAAPLRLHILKKPGSSSDSLEQALIQYATDPKFSGRMKNPIIQSYDIGHQ